LLLFKSKTVNEEMIRSRWKSAFCNVGVLSHRKKDWFQNLGWNQ